MKKQTDSLNDRDFKNIKASTDIEETVEFVKNMLTAEHVIVWFRDTKEDSYISLLNETRMRLPAEYVDSFFIESNTIQYDMDMHHMFLGEVQMFSEYMGMLEDVVFHKQEDKPFDQTILIQIMNIDDEELFFQSSFHNTLKLIADSLLQSINMNGLSSITNYYLQEQEKAYTKQKAVLQNDLKNSKIFDVEIFYKPSDILNGDSYSIYKAPNGDILIYVLDAMGHGIGPSLTAYSISVIIQQSVKTSSNFNDFMKKVLDNVQCILTDEEQLTCGFFWFAKDLSKVEYVVAGMYSPIILDANKIISAKANNIPFMNFASDFLVTSIELKNFQKFLIFTDGLVEDTKDLKINLNDMLKNDKYAKKIYKELSQMALEDDTTIIKLIKKDL